MNQPFEQNQNNGYLHTSTLISLFEEKGYECEEITRDKETIYVMKFDSSTIEKVLEPAAELTIH